MFVQALGCAALFALSSCAPAAEPEPIAASELVDLHIADGVDSDVALCAISILVDDLDPEVLRPDANLTPIDELKISETFNACGAANELLNEPEDKPAELAFSIEPQIYGDDRVLDKLWESCEAGDGEACDSLWLEAPVGSVYEQFGVTCGDRLDVLNCAEELVVDPDAVDDDAVEAGDDDDEGDDATADSDDNSGTESADEDNADSNDG